MSRKNILEREAAEENKSDTGIQIKQPVNQSTRLSKKNKVGKAQQRQERSQESKQQKKDTTVSQKVRVGWSTRPDEQP